MPLPRINVTFLLPFLALLALLAAGWTLPARADAPRPVCFTVSVWANFVRTGGDAAIVPLHSDDNTIVLQRVNVHGDRLAFRLEPILDAEKTQGAFLTTDFAPTPGVWYQIVGVYDGGTREMRLYVNGTPLKTATDVAWRGDALPTLGATVPLPDPQVVVGATAILPRALTDAEVAAHYAKELPKTVGANTFTYANPIYYQGNGRDADIHDPDIINEGGVYYCVATLAPFRNYTDRDPKLPDWGSSLGVRLYASRDLKVWKDKGWLMKSSEIPDDAPYKHQFWAPEIHKFNGRFYLIVGASNWLDDKYNIGGKMGYYQFVGVADKINGPYWHFVALKGPGVDTSLFQDDDGKTYAVWPWNEIHPIDLTQIDRDIVTVGPKLSQATTPEMFKALGKAVPNTIEGPYLIKHAGTYYCFFAETYPDLYATGISTAKSLAGPWTLDPRWRVFPGGHQAEFIGPDGRWWTAYKREKSPTTPWLSIDPLNFAADGNVQITPTIGPTNVPLAPTK